MASTVDPNLRYLARQRYVFFKLNPKIGIKYFIIKFLKALNIRRTYHKIPFQHRLKK